ncbi:hypothetical protein F5Y12DRAFT_34669 [Xylaria sp. FL1777]|nr:hypothetical protein F5Y12DRAFT_34669 [Xylaria sp. FL1777]
MDDPWGSPWASTDAPSDNDPSSSSRADIFLSPPPKAFFGNGTSLSPQSPWSGNHDDGALGIWTTAGQADDADNQNEWGAWAESVVQPPRLSPRLNASGKESPLAWPENAAASPVFIGNSRSRTPSILRHHSPDPWATELSLTKRSDVELPDSIETPTSDVLAIEVKQVGDVSRPSPEVAESGGDQSASSETAPVEEEFAVRRNDCPRTSHDLAGEHANATSQLDSAVYEPPSRPSSTCTNDSHDRPERQDSPITSIDEDRGARMQNNSGKTSAKVQELVGIYDGLARATSEEPPTVSRRGIPHTANCLESRVQSEIEDNDIDDGVSFKSFEHMPADDDQVVRSPGKSPSEFSSTPKAELPDVFTQKLEYEGEEDCVATTETAPAQLQSSLNQFRDVKFDMHLSLVDKLFPDLPDSPVSCSTEDWEVPDHVVDDSFTTISERKGWYRISRYGSMRRHNSGDDENYHRVTWPTSQLHADIIKIVRRWMEEDSYAGKAILGGTKRTGFFDWDSDAAPVELGQVFRRRKSVTKHTRTTSIPANKTTIQTGSANERAYRNSTGISLPAELKSASQPIIAAPSFGWNSGAKEILPTTRFSNSSQPLNSVPDPAPFQTASSMDEDDEDWGEMVSSPRVAKDHIEPSLPVFPLPETPTKGHEPKSRLPFTVSNVDQSAEPKLPAPRDTPRIGSDPSLFPDVSVLNRSKPALKSLTRDTYQTKKTFPVPKANAPPPNQASFESLNQGSTITDERPNEKSVNIASKRIVVASNPLQGDEIQDDIVVQEILQHLPDLSYMLR